MPSLDLNALPLFRQDGQDRNDLPGLYMATPPRRAARGRDADRLILYFAMLGNAPLPADQIEPLLTRLAQIFYKTPGSITAAMRSGADHLNLFLLDRNLRGSNAGRQGVGLLVIGVLREDRLTLAHCGPAHTFVITAQETQHLHEPQGSRGLGLTRAVSLRYYQIELRPTDLLVIASQPPPAWTALTLQNVQSLGIETLRRRLLGHAGPDLSAVLVQAQVGAGKLRLLRPKAPVQMASPMPGSPDVVQPVDDSPVPAESNKTTDSVPPAEMEQPGTPEGRFADGRTEAPPWEPDREPGEQTAGEAFSEGGNSFETSLHPSEPGLDRSLEEAGFEPLSRGEPAGGGKFLPSLRPAPEKVESFPAPTKLDQRPAAPLPATAAQSPIRSVAASPLDRKTPEPARNAPVVPQTEPRPRPASRRSLPRISFAPALKGLAPIGLALGTLFRRIATGLHLLLKRMLPDESLFNIPASTMIFVAVAVAVIIATSGGAVYFQRGRQIQHLAFFDQAVLAAQNAEGQTDPNELRTGWETALDFLDRAEIYQVTENSKGLRRRAQDALDGLDSILRLNFQAAIPGGLGSQVLANRLVVAENDLYLLNANGGNVLRAVRTGRGYEIDGSFECSPNPQIGALVDIAALPKDSEFGATLLAMDARGNLLYCIPGEKPVSRFPNIPQPTDQGMRAFVLDSGTLYILDPGNNAVWYYRGMEIDQPPHTYFGPDRPDDVQGIIDMTANRDDLFLLHKDGYIVKCTFGGLRESPTRCEDPATIVDPRQGRSNGPVIRDARFDQILFTPPPDPSLYLLDPVNNSIYHFGLRLTFQRQYRPANPLPSTAVTAFAITQNRTIFLVAGGQVYTTLLP
jgi:hypothetical protein